MDAPEFLASTNATLRELIKLGDTKAGALLTFTTVLAGAVAGMVARTFTDNGPLFLPILVGLVLLITIFGIGVGLSAWGALAALAPKTLQGQPSLGSFVDISTMKPEDYARSAIEMNAHRVSMELAAYNWTLSEIARGKFSALRRSVFWLKTAVVAAGLLVLCHLYLVAF